VCFPPRRLQKQTRQTSNTDGEINTGDFENYYGDPAFS
jgi:hypothetical protein